MSYLKNSKRISAILTALFLCTNFVNNKTYAQSINKTQIKKATNSSITVKDYNGFYAAIKNAVKSKKTSVSINTNNYSQSIYNLNKAMDQVQNQCFNLKYYIDSANASVSGIKGSKSKTINISISYDVVDTVASDKKSLISSNINSVTINSYDELYNNLKRSMDRCDDSITFIIKDSKVRDNLLKTINTVLEDNPNIAYVNKWKTLTSSNTVNVTLNYSFPKDKIINMKNKINIKVKAIIKSIIKTNMSQLQKEKAIHDYIVNNTRYDEENLKKGTIPEECYSAYGALINGIAVCEGYAKAMYVLCKEANIDCIVIKGNANNGGGSVGHAWNIVKINNKYYHVDTTWDDPIFFYNGVKTNTLKYNYFNISDAKMSQNHNWDAAKYPKCK